jgi:hypothetical protein
MTNLTARLIGRISLLALVFGIAPAHALNVRSFVSANGNDTNNCGRATPCRSLQVAHDKTAAGGEINMLDPAGYGTVTITKSISIVNDGVGSAGVLVPTGQTGITINAGINDRINLRGPIIEGAGLGATGIAFTSGKSLTIGKCIVRNLSSSGIAFAPSASYPFGTYIYFVVTDTLVADNGGHGIYIQPSSTGVAVDAVLNRVEAYNNAQDGIGMYGNAATTTDILVSIEASVAANNGVGFRTFTTAGHAGVFSFVSHSTASTNKNAGFSAAGDFASIRVLHSYANAAGILSFEADDNAEIYLSDSATASFFSIANGAKIYTYGDNILLGGIGGTLTPVGKQ